MFHKGSAMVPRFPSKIETEYASVFPDTRFNVLAYMEACVFKEYETLLKKAIERKKEVTLEELIDIAGEESYLERKAYLEAWGVTDA